MNKNISKCWMITMTMMATILGSQLDGAETGRDPWQVVTDEVRNDHPSFMVRVDVDRPDRIYTGGDEMRVRVVSAQDGYLYLLYCDAGGNVSCLFPNAFGEDNQIVAKRPVVVPQPASEGNSNFRLRIGPPYGREVLKAIVSRTPLDAATLGRLMTAENTQARLSGIRAVYVEETKDADWAEHHVKIVTQDPLPTVVSNSQSVGESPSNIPMDRPTTSATIPSPSASSDAMISNDPPRRVGVFIGISQYADERIRDLSVCANDATMMAQVMKDRGQVGQGWILLNEQATRQNIEHVLRQQVPTATRPGDSVIIYWSGHGSRCADDGGDESDGFDEYLVPHDGRLDDVPTIRNTMVLDDTFGRWIQELDGRRVVVLLDTCHSGGLASQEKSIGHKSNTNSAKDADGQFDFLDSEFGRIKDIGQRDTALLASSSASQVSFERREGDLSTMTYFLVDHINQGEGPLTLVEVFTQLKSSVAEYVEKKFPGTTQTPILVSDLAGPFYLRP